MSTLLRGIPIALILHRMLGHDAALFRNGDDVPQGNFTKLSD